MKSITGSLRRRIAERLLLFIAEDRANGSSIGKNKSFMRSLRNAIKGIALTFLSERNFRFELAVGFLACVLGVFFRISTTEWAIVATNIFYVLSLEVKNTSLELTVDMVTREYHYNAKGSKDAASGAVLLAALSSLVTAGLVFVPKVFALLGQR